ncbi:phosphoglucosamine mutase [Draconibacterium sp. IB214405]|uniref:phosphoglucosamine mutase n=1 Tax=Draconibacterium sp. IB214405 TaxID=3097352 RepID=UPI002A12E682|nr:phosphoglucosamine mutase [Draconibacterium sp. IB214405]MDX8340674.1 phosphoglucosamine mutase [Draconibacterium sp. IB214405]
MALISSISGIRGTIGGQPGESLSPFDILKFAGAYGTWIKQNAEKPTVVIGRDARVSGQMVLNLIVGTLNSLGIDVIDLGLAPTPTVEIAIPMEKANGGIIITASHNPGNWNALKLLNNKGEFISQADGEEILKQAQKAAFDFVEAQSIGTYITNDCYIDKHIESILNLPLVNKEAIKEAQLKVAVDSVNSVGNPSIPKLLKALGIAEVVEIFAEPNGKFSRIAEPLEENLTELCKTVSKNNLDLGIAVDPDVDRLALVDENGKAFGEEYTLVSISDYILSNTPGTIAANLSSTNALKDIAKKHDVQFYESAVGEVNVVEQMKNVNAVIGGEGNGGVIYPELHYGRDALVGIALFLTQLAESKKSASKIRAQYPNYEMLKDKIEFDANVDLNQLLQEVKASFPQCKTNEIDGLKLYFEDGWAHMRKSNTEPIVRIYIESTSLDRAKEINIKIRSITKTN